MSECISLREGNTLLYWRGILAFSAIGRTPYLRFGFGCVSSHVAGDVPTT